MGVRVAGALCLVLAAGHTLVGYRWILPRLRRHGLPTTSFGDSSTTAVAVTVTWDVVTIAVAAMGVLLFGVAGRSASAERSLVLETVATVFALAAVRVLWLGRRGPRRLAQRPMWVLFIVVAVLCATNA